MAVDGQFLSYSRKSTSEEAEEDFPATRASWGNGVPRLCKAVPASRAVGCAHDRDVKPICPCRIGQYSGFRW